MQLNRRRKSEESVLDVILNSMQSHLGYWEIIYEKKRLTDYREHERKNGEDK